MNILSPGPDAPTSSLPLRNITSQEKAAFRRDGVVVLRQVLPTEWVDYLRRELERAFREGSKTRSDRAVVLAGLSRRGERIEITSVAKMMLNNDETTPVALDLPVGEEKPVFKGRSVVETFPSLWQPHLNYFHQRSPMPQLMAQLLEEKDRLCLYHDQIFLKEPGSLVRTPWHQDLPYFTIDGADIAVAWVPVDVVTRDNGAMQYVPGSHLDGQQYIPSDFLTKTGDLQTTYGLELPEGNDDEVKLKSVPDIEGREGEFGVISFDAMPGDVIVHHVRTLHGSTGNITSNATRRAASIRYCSANTIFNNRVSSPDPTRNLVALKSGQKVSDDPVWFPVVWRNGEDDGDGDVNKAKL